MSNAAIQASLATPPIHPNDKNLLRPVSDLGKPIFNAAVHSFLRRTEYISSEARARAEANANAVRNTTKPAVARVRKLADTSKEDPMSILRSTVRGFDLANSDDVYMGVDSTTDIRGAQSTPAETEAWKRPKHPSKADLKLLDAYPLMPDLDAVTDSGAYMITKFAGNPTAATDKRDTRMDVGILYPRERAPGVYDYEMFLPVDDAEALKVKRKLDVYNPDQDDPTLYTHKDAEGNGFFKYPHIRSYESSRRLDQPDHQYKEVALALHDHHLDNDGSLQGKGAFYYPIVSKLQLKPRRNKNLVRLGLASQSVDDEAEMIDQVNLQVQNPDETEAAWRRAHRETLEQNPEGSNQMDRE